MAVRPATPAIVTALLVGTVACSGTSTGPSSPATALVSVTPTGGATSVPPSAPIVITFSHAMGSGMEMYVSLHDGDVTGPTVPCVANWSSDRMTLTFTPSAPLKSATAYALHVGGGMKDADGNPIDMTVHGMMGGQWASGSMMNGGGMMGGQEMGPGWMGSNGMYGLAFRFTTA
jgi:Bacterial Ig-like domain